MPASSAPPPGLLYIDDHLDPNGARQPGIATRLGITPGTFRKWRMAGKGPDSFVLGGKVVARETAVDAYIAGLEKAAQLPRHEAESRPPEHRIPRTPQAA